MIKLIPKELNGGYVVQRGDTFGGIALKHGLSVEQLKQLNPSITNPDKIREGVTILVDRHDRPVVSRQEMNTQWANLERNPNLSNYKYTEYGNAYRTFDKAYNLWAAKNPQIKLNGVSINTNLLKDYIYDLAMHESSFDNNKVNGSHRGYFQITNYRGNDPFGALINHMNERLARLTSDDIQRARGRKISDAAILAKIHNQGDNFVNWLWGGADTKDGVGTAISLYGNDWAPKLNILHKVVTRKALRPGQYAIVQPRESFETYSPYVRYKGVLMANTVKLMLLEFRRHYPQRKEPWVGDTLFIPQVRKNGGKLKLIARQ